MTPTKQRAAAQAAELTRAARSAARLAQRVAQAQRAGALVVIVQDPDEALALAEVEQAAATAQPVKILSAADPEATTELEGHAQGRGTLILLDFLAVYGQNPVTVRMVREVALQRRGQGEKYSRLILLEQPGTTIPPGLSGDVEVIRPTLPGLDELRQELDGFLSALADSPGAPDPNEAQRYALTTALAGLPRHEAARLLARCWVETSTMDAAWLRAEKARRVALRLGGALTFESPASADVGGLDQLKAWLRGRRAAFGSKAARDWGLPEPKGLLLLGTPGSGKSLTARTVAREWELPLLRLDAGRLFGSLVGQSEAQTRAAIEAAEACAPCVLWVDEIEKGLAGSGGGAGDSGTSARVFGSLLTWLQEKTAPVFVVATANRISQLPPELLRKGRFDEIFYVGLPTVAERAEILEIHLAKRGRRLEPGLANPNGASTADEVHAELVRLLAEDADGFSGAELEQAVLDGMFRAYAEGRALLGDDVGTAIRATTPLSVTMAEEISRLEAWASTRARPASSKPAAELSASRRNGAVGGWRQRPGVSL